MAVVNIHFVLRVPKSSVNMDNVVLGANFNSPFISMW